QGASTRTTGRAIHAVALTAALGPASTATPTSTAPRTGSENGRTIAERPRRAPATRSRRVDAGAGSGRPTTTATAATRSATKTVSRLSEAVMSTSPGHAA